MMMALPDVQAGSVVEIALTPEHQRCVVVVALLVLFNVGFTEVLPTVRGERELI